MEQVGLVVLILVCYLFTLSAIGRAKKEVIAEIRKYRRKVRL